MKQINFLLFFVVGFCVNAQTITGKILSKDENKAIPYAKIGVENSEIGAIADEKGNFTFDLSKAAANANVKVEVAGFQTYRKPVQDFVKNNSQTIYLEEKVRDIAEVKIATKKLVDKNWGVNTKTKSIMYCVEPRKSKQGYLHQTALEFSAKKKTKIEKINLNIARIDIHKPVVLRYSIYNEKNGLPNELITEEEIIAELTKDKIKDDTFTVDVSKEHIWVQGKFFVAIEFMQDFEGYVCISAAPFRAGFTRTFYGNWEKVNIIAPAINIDVKVDKNYQNSELDRADSSNLFQNIEGISRYKDEASTSVFGKNNETGKTIKFSDHEIYYEVYGNGEPLILLHGNNGSIQDFYKQIDEFSKYYKVYAIDTRGQGKSKDFTKDKFTYELLAEDLKQFTDKLNLKKEDILGWSDGGNTALIYNMKYPENVNKLITVGAVLNPKGVDKMTMEYIKQNLTLKKLENNPNDFNSIRLMKLLVSEPNINPKNLSKIQNPVMVVAGEKDVVLEEHTKLIARSIPHSQLQIIKGTSHYCVWEKPEEFNKMVLDFLRN